MVGPQQLQVVELYFPGEDSAEVKAIADRAAREIGDEDDTEAPRAPEPAPDKVFYLAVIAPGAGWPPASDAISIVRLSLEPDQLAIDARREVRAIFVVHGWGGTNLISTSFRFSLDFYLDESAFPKLRPLIKNAASLSPEQVRVAIDLVPAALRRALDDLKKDTDEGLDRIGAHAVKLGRDRLPDLRQTIENEALRYIDPRVLGFSTVKTLLKKSDKAHQALRGEGMRALVASLREIKQDRLALMRAAERVKATGDKAAIAKAHVNFEIASAALTSTVEDACEAHPVLYRLWNEVFLPDDAAVDSRGELVTSSRAGIDLISGTKLRIGKLLTSAYRANLELYDTLTPENVWELAPLIDLALEDLDELENSVLARAARAKVEEAETSTLADSLATTAGVLEMGGVLLGAAPPVLLGLAATGLVFGILALVEEYADLTVKDRAANASLDPRLALSTEQSPFGFYVSVAFTLLDIRGVRDAVKTVRLARYGGELDEALDVFKAGTQ